MNTLALTKIVQQIRPQYPEHGLRRRIRAGVDSGGLVVPVFESGALHKV